MIAYKESVRHETTTGRAASAAAVVGAGMEDSVNQIDRRASFIEEAARNYVRTLRENVDAFYANRVSYEQFCDENRKIWNTIHGAALKTQYGMETETRVLEMLRGDAR